MIHKEKPEIDSSRIDKVRDRLNQASEEEVLRLYDTFSRFGINVILEVIS